MRHQEVVHMLKQHFFPLVLYSNEQLVQNMAERLRKDIDSVRVVPKVEELLQEE